VQRRRHRDVDDVNARGVDDLVGIGGDEGAIDDVRELAGPLLVGVANRDVLCVDEAETDHRPDGAGVEPASQAAPDETDVQSQGRRRC